MKGPTVPPADWTSKPSIASLKPKRFAEVTPAARGAGLHVRLTLGLGFPGIGAMTKISATQPKRHSRLPIVLKCLICANR